MTKQSSDVGGYCQLLVGTHAPVSCPYFQSLTYCSPIQFSCFSSSVWVTDFVIKKKKKKKGLSVPDSLPAGWDEREECVCVVEGEGAWADAEIEIPSAETPNLSEILSLKPEVSQNIALRITPSVGKCTFSKFCHPGLKIWNWTRPKALVQNQHTREDVPLLEFMYLVFTRKPGESYRRRLRL